MAITEAALLNMWKKSHEIYERFRHSAADNAPGDSFSNKSLVQLHTEMDALLQGTRIASVEATVLQARADMVTFISGAKQAIQNFVLEYKQVAGLAGTSFDTLWPKLYRYYAENAKRVLSRGIVFGTAAAGGSNRGNGFTYRLNQDAWGFTIENQTANATGDAKLVRCVRDSVLGTLLAEEEFTIESTTEQGRDALEEKGSGKETTQVIPASSARNSQSYGLQNPSFSSCTPAGVTTAPTDLGGFTSEVSLGGAALPVSAASYEIRGTDYYRGYEGDTTPLYLRTLAFNWCISQNLDSNGGQFNTDKAYFFQVAIRKQNTADGSITLRIGTKTVVVALTSLTNNVWYLLQIPFSGATATNCWYKNFGEPSLKWSLARSAGTTGQVDVDDIVIDEWKSYDGGLYIVCGGPTAFSIEDKFTFTDTEYGGVMFPTAVGTVGNAINQKMLWRLLGLYLPACPSQPTAPTSALAGAGAGNCTNGNHSVYTTYTDVNGIESPLSIAAAPLNVANNAVNGQITATRAANPGTTTHLASWNVYMSAAGTTTPAFRVGTAIALGTTTANINVSDATLATLPAAPTHTISFAEPP